MADKARYAFGNSENIQAALENGTINLYDILFLDGDTSPKVGWVDKNGVVKVVDTECVVVGEVLPETGVSGKFYILDNTTEGSEGVSIWNDELKAYVVVADKTQGITEDDVLGLFD